MQVLRSDRFAAIALAVAAVVGLLVANSAVGASVSHFFDAHVAVPNTFLDLSTKHWITDGLLAVFFFIVSVDLRHEFTRGELNTVRKAIVPAIAALGGVMVPAAIFLAFVGSDFHNDYTAGWPIPTATDIAFALGLIALVGRNLPKRIRAFLLALAVLDDLIAIVIIAVFFAHDVNGYALAGAGISLLAFWMSNRPNRVRGLRLAFLLFFGLLTWALVWYSGVHATIAGVALGLVLQRDLAEKTVHHLLPVNNTVILPLFAFVSALVMLPNTPLWAMSMVFWAIVVALPVGKILGITLAGWLANTLTGNRSASAVRGWDLVTVGAVGGIGFTVSLLMNELAFANSPELRDQGVLGVLTGSAISIVVGGLFVAWRARVNTRAGGHERIEEGLDPTD